MIDLVLGLFAILGVGAFWFYRMRDVGRAAGDVVDYAQRARGFWSRRRFNAKASDSAITAIHDPVTAAAIALTVIAAQNGPLGSPAETLILDELRRVAGRPSDDALIYAKWAIQQFSEPNRIIAKLGPLLAEKLDLNERRDLLGMAQRAAVATGGPNRQQENLIGRLQTSMGLP